MPSKKSEWPAWPEFVFDKTLDADDDYVAAKRDIIAEYGESALRESWLKTCATLKTLTEQIIEKGRDAFPVLDMKDVEEDSISSERQEELRKVGSFIVRGVVDPAEVKEIFQNLKVYTNENKGRYSCWPIETPSIFNLYNTPSQNAARSHPNQLRLMRWINELWHWSKEDPEISSDPLLYADGVRIRPAGQQFLGLGPHIDAGSLCRWGDPQYREVYRNIFSGCPENHDCFDLDARKSANQSLFEGLAHSTVFRAFQGWTALTRAAPYEGTIMLYPNVKTSIAYVLLRPFFRPPENPADLLDAEKWAFDHDGSWFPGTLKSQSQLLSDSSHPHLRLKECLLHVPELQPGDTIWWHTDMCHAVDAEHLGDGDASVAYIAATPSTPINRKYMQEQHKRMAVGLAPQDFGHGVDESKLVGFEGFSRNPELFAKLMAC